MVTMKKNVGTRSLPTAPLVKALDRHQRSLQPAHGIAGVICGYGSCLTRNKMAPWCCGSC